MTVADWLVETRERFREQPADTALAESTDRFLAGARSHLAWLAARYYSPDGAVTARFGDIEARFVVDSREDTKRARTAIRERPVLEWFIEPIDEGWTVWDVGAFHGTYAITCAKKGADVVGFEPNQETRSRLSDNMHINDVGIRVFSDALSDTTGMVRFGGDELHPRKGITDHGEQQVRATRGDSLSIGQPDALKVDVEGHECAVLDGMGETLESVRRVLIEVHDGVDPAAVRDRLESAGLKTHVRRVDRPQPYVCGVRE